MITGTLYVSFAVKGVDRTRRTLRDVFGLSGERMEPDAFLGTDNGARIPFPNDCWLYIVQSEQSVSPIGQFIAQKGPGLERVAFASDDIEAEFERVRRGGVQLSDDALVDTSLGRRFVVPAERVAGIKVELIQPAPEAWRSTSMNNDCGILSFQHIGIAVKDLVAAKEAFGQLFDLYPAPIVHERHLSFTTGNEYHWLDIAEGKRGQSDRLADFLEAKGPGLEHFCLELADIRDGVKRANAAGIRFFDSKIYTDRPNGLEAFIYPEYTTGVTIEIIEPYPTSPGYREK